LYIGTPEHDHVGTLQFIDQRVRIGSFRALAGVAFFRLRNKCLEPLGCQVRHRLLRKIAHDHGCGGIVFLPAGDEIVGEPARGSGIRKEARVDLQKGLVHGASPISVGQVKPFEHLLNR
jgi:hypothetical protein